MRRYIRFLGAIIAVTAIGGLAAYLWSVGLDRADKPAIVGGLIAAVIGLLVTFVSRPGRRGDSRDGVPGPSPAAATGSGGDADRPGAGGRTSVVNKFAGEAHGPVVQAGSIGGDVSIGPAAPAEDQPASGRGDDR